MAKRYEFLRPFCNPQPAEGLERQNWFYPVVKGDVESAEKTLGLKLPSQLKEFYQEIGHGCLAIPYNAGPDYKFYSANQILSPNVIVGILLEGPDGGDISEDAYEELKPGDIPFFEIGDSSSFLIMKALSDNPNAVWCDEIKIEDSLERFIWRLYYEDPGYYGEIIYPFLDQN